MKRALMFLFSSLMFTVFQPTVSQQAVVMKLESGAAHQARSANDFVESIGVNTHLGYSDTAYGNYRGLLKPSLLYLGVRHIRDGIDDDGVSSVVLKRYRDLHSHGIQTTPVSSPTK